MRDSCELTVAARGDVLIVTGRFGFKTLDVSDPTKPEVLDTLRPADILGPDDYWQDETNEEQTLRCPHCNGSWESVTAPKTAYSRAVSSVGRAPARQDGATLPVAPLNGSVERNLGTVRRPVPLDFPVAVATV